MASRLEDRRDDHVADAGRRAQCRDAAQRWRSREPRFEPSATYAVTASRPGSARRRTQPARDRAVQQRSGLPLQEVSRRGQRAAARGIGEHARRDRVAVRRDDAILDPEDQQRGRRILLPEQRRAAQLRAEHALVGAEARAQLRARRRRARVMKSTSSRAERAAVQPSRARCRRSRCSDAASRRCRARRRARRASVPCRTK